MFKRFLISIVTVVFVAVGVRAQGAPPKLDLSNPEESVRAAVIPFVNYTGSSDALNIILPEVIKGLNQKQITTVPGEDLRKILRQYRIRSTGMINREDGTTIGREAKVDYLVLGSLDFFETERILEVGVSVRIVEIASMNIVWANSYSATGDDYLKLFGLGRITDAGQLTSRVVNRLLEKLTVERMMSQSKARSESKATVAIIPFDNLTRQQWSGGVVSNLLLAELFAAGANVIEPGMINETLVRRMLIPRGEIDLASMQSLHQEYGVNFVFTGTIDDFVSGHAGDDLQNAAPPVMALSLRVLDGETGKIMAMYNYDKNGSEDESIFRLGRINSLGRLSAKLLHDITAKFFEGHEYELAASK